MILRYLLIILIILTLASVFVLPENFLELTIFDNSKKQAISTRLPQIYPYPVPSANYNQPPQVTAKSAIIIDAASGISLFEKEYRSRLDKVVPDLKLVFSSFPRRRERHLHIGLISYGRKMNKVNLPRAITFTGSFYSLP